jgi:lipoate-protein ligase A
MRIIDYKENTGKYNMDFDLEMLNQSVREKDKEPVLRFYGWSPACVSLGRNQAENKINNEYCREHDIDIVKRVTGGRGLLHDDEVTYSFVCPIDFLNAGDSVINSYKEISSAIIEGFKNIDINLELGGKKKVEASHDYCMLLSTGADLSYNGKKLIGSAQYRTQGYLLQHGSVLFSYNKEVIENIFNEKTNENSITCINEINTKLTRYDITEAMKKGFKEFFTAS